MNDQENRDRKVQRELLLGLGKIEREMKDKKHEYYVITSTPVTLPAEIGHPVTALAGSIDQNYPTVYQTSSSILGLGKNKESFGFRQWKTV